MRVYEIVSNDQAHKYLHGINSLTWLLLCCECRKKEAPYIYTRQPIAVRVQDLLLNRHWERIVKLRIFEVMVGKSSDNIELRGEFEILADDFN